MTSDSPDSHPEPKLRIRSLYKSFTVGVKREHVLAGVDLAVEGGEFVSIIGPSGCGKSTLLNIIAGLDQPDSGSVSLDGGQDQARLGRVGYMQQKDLLLPWRTVLDNAILGLELRGVSRRQARKQALQLTESFGLSGFEDQYPFALSGGMRQRAAFLRTMLLAQELVLLDEPFGALDALTRVQMQEWLLNLWDSMNSTNFGINYQPDLLMARAQGVPVVSIAPLVQHPLNTVQTLEASGITRPSELVGKKVGYPGIPLNEPLLDTMLKADGVAGGLEEVELVNVGFNLAEMLINKTVDACVGCYFSHESFLMENQGHPVNVMRMEEWGVPDFYELVLVTSEKMLEENPGVAQRLVRALMKGYADAAADPDAAVNTLLAANKGEVDEAIERPGIQVMISS